jgi:hypothetical protein
VSTDPFVQMRTFFNERENVPMSRLGDAFDEKPPIWVNLRDWKWVVRQNARQRALAIITRMESQPLDAVYRAAEIDCRNNNPYVVINERTEFEKWFKSEVDEALDVLIAMGRR